MEWHLERGFKCVVQKPIYLTKTPIPDWSEVKCLQNSPLAFYQKRPDLTSITPMYPIFGTTSEIISHCFTMRVQPELL